MIADKTGLNPVKTASVPGYVFGFNLSRDGERMLFQEYRKGKLYLREISVDAKVNRDIQMLGSDRCCFVWSADRKFILYAQSEGDQRDIWALPTENWMSRGSPEPIRLTTGPKAFSDPFPSRDGKQIFVTGLKSAASWCITIWSRINSCPSFPGSLRPTHRHRGMASGSSTVPILIAACGEAVAMAVSGCN